MLMRVRASMFVATAERGSIPNWSMAGTVMSEVPPVTTLIMLVRKKMTTRGANSIFLIRVYTKWMRRTTMGLRFRGGVIVAALHVNEGSLSDLARLLLFTPRPAAVPVPRFTFYTVDVLCPLELVEDPAEGSATDSAFAVTLGFH